MIRVGIIGPEKEYAGGINYFKNLVYAIKNVPDKKIEIYYFIGKKFKDEYKILLRKYCQVVEHPLFDRGSMLWTTNKIIQKVFDYSPFTSNILKKYKTRDVGYFR